MLCEKCGQREATVHIVQCTSPGGVAGKKDLCEECSRDQVTDLEKTIESQHAAWLKVVEPILTRD